MQPRSVPARSRAGTSGIEQEARLLTSNAELHLPFVDLSPGALARRHQLLEPRFPGRVATMLADLNFLELGDESYDLIISVSSVHHVVNLEHLAWQINRGLTPSGTFFLHDYVGECCFQFAPEKKRLSEVLSYREALRARRQPGVVWFGDGDLSPFCGVRSNEILATFRQFFHEEDVRTAGALLVPVLRHCLADAGAAPAARSSVLRRLRRRLRAGTPAWPTAAASSCATSSRWATRPVMRASSTRTTPLPAIARRPARHAEDTCDRSHRPGQAPPAPVPRHGGRCGRVATPLVV